MDKRIFGTLIALGAISTGFAQLEGVPDARGDFAMGPARLESLLPQLSKRLGVVIDADPVYANDVLVIQAREVSGRELLQRISTVERGVWRKDERGLHLRRTTEQTGLEYRADIDEVRRRANEGLAGIRKSVPGPLTKASADEWMQKFVKLATQMINLPAAADQESRDLYQKLLNELVELTENRPTSALLPRLVSSMTADDLMQIPEGLTWAYATQPNRMQHGFTAAQKAAVQGNAKDLETLAAAVRANHSLHRAAQHEVFENVLSGLVQPAPADQKLILLVSNYGKGNFGARLASLGGEAHEVEWTDLSIRASSAPMEFSPSMRGSRLHPGPDLAKVLSYRRAYLVALDPEIGRIMRPMEVNPSANEPAALSAVSLLPEMADLAKSNLVALVPDSVVGSTVWEPSNEINFGKVADFLAAQQMSVRRDGGWLMLEPTFPAEARAKRVDRKLLGTFLSAYADGRTLSWPELSGVAAKPGAVLAEAMATNIFNQYGSFMLSRRWDSLQVIGGLASFTASQRRAAESAEGCPLSELTPMQRKAIESMVFTYTDSRQGLASSQISKPELQQAILYGEPTLLFPDGLPAGARLHIDLNVVPVAYVPADPMVQPLMPAAAAQQLLSAEKNQTQYDPALVFGETHGGSVYLEIGGKIRCLETYQATTFDTKKVLPLSRAPEGYAAAVRAALAQIQK